MDNKFQKQYRIPSARATWHDYNGGAYFVTICTKKREHFFGEIENAIMQLSATGKFADENLHDITHHYPYAEIPLWVVMPNHIHVVVFIDGEKFPYQRGNGVDCRDGAQLTVSNPPLPNSQTKKVLNLRGRPDFKIV